MTARDCTDLCVGCGKFFPVDLSHVKYVHILREGTEIAYCSACARKPVMSTLLRGEAKERDNKPRQGKNMRSH